MWMSAALYSTERRREGLWLPEFTQLSSSGSVYVDENHFIGRIIFLRQVMVHQSEQLHWSLKCGASEPEKQQNIVTIYKQQYH